MPTGNKPWPKLLLTSFYDILEYKTALWGDQPTGLGVFWHVALNDDIFERS